MSLACPKTGMRKRGMGKWGTDFYFFFLDIGIWKLNKSSLVLLPSQVLHQWSVTNPYPTHYPGDNLGNVVDEYSKTPAGVGDHAPLQRCPALNGCRSPKVHHPHPYRAEDPCRAPQCAPATPTSPFQPCTPELFLLLHPKAAGATSPQDSRCPCSSWQAEKHGSFSTASSRRARAVLTTSRKCLETC